MSEGLANPPYAIQLKPVRFLYFDAIPGRPQLFLGVARFRLCNSVSERPWQLSEVLNDYLLSERGFTHIGN